MLLETELRRLIREEVRTGIREALQVERPSVSGVADELVSITQAAALGGYSAATIRKWLKDGQLKRYGAGRASRVSRAELMRLLERQATTSSGGPATDADIEERALTLLKR